MKKNILFFTIGFILATSITAVAFTVASGDVSYDNTNSNLNATNAQDAIDELYDMANNSELKETILWENPNPNANFSDSTVTLSDNINNYKYLGIKYKFYGATSNDDYSTYIISVPDFKRSLSGTGNPHDIVTIGITNANNEIWARIVYYVSDTSIRITNIYRLYYQQVTSDGSNPLQIVGLN